MAAPMNLSRTGKVLVEVEIVSAWNMALKILLTTQLRVSQRESRIDNDKVF
jgi:hypothetical protein